MAVQVSGVHLVGAEVDPEPLRGIKTFVRDILPHRPHASPEGGTTPVLSDPGLEDTWTDNSHLKRKSCLKEGESADSDGSDSEHLPSSKRQRITVSAMRRLFAKFSLSDTNEALQPATIGASGRAVLASSAREAIPRHSPERDTSLSNTEDNLDESRTKSQDTDPNQFSVKVQSEKRISETDTNEEHGDKRQKTSDKEAYSEDDNQDTREIKDREKENEDHKEETDVEEEEKTVVKSDDTSKTNKRQADMRESDTEEREEMSNKVKRTRRLRRGLRLCTNITCYIEQVLYN